MMSSLYGLELVVDKGCPDERITAIPVVDIVFEIGKALKHVLYVRGDMAPCRTNPVLRLAKPPGILASLAHSSEEDTMRLPDKPVAQGELPFALKERTLQPPAGPAPDKPPFPASCRLRP